MEALEDSQDKNPLTTYETSFKRRSESPIEIKSPKEEILTYREKSSSVKIGRGITDSSFVELKDDGKSVFKTEHYQQERAAYLIDRFLGINLTPPTVIRVLDGEMGSMQEFIPDSKVFSEMEFRTVNEEDEFIKKHREKFIKMWVFDLILNNVDRHGGNFLFSSDVLYAIDHGHSLRFEGFSEKVDLSNGYKKFFGVEIPVALVQSMKRFLENVEYQKILEDLLEELLGKEFAVACLKRIKLIGRIVVETGKIENKSNRVYLFL